MASRLIHQDCFDLMDQAIANVKGTRIKFPDHGAAWHFRLRLHKARRIDREDNTRTFERDHPMYGRSIYDPLVVKIRVIDGDTWLYLEKLSVEHFVVESLDVDDETASGDSGE